MKDKKIPLVSRETLFSFCLVTALFILWGFANAITEPMVIAFKKVLEISNSKAAWVQMAFYSGYFCMALPAALFIQKYSYKKGILIGLLLFAIGALLFYPAAIFENFYFFCIGLYILTFGLSFLETTANPYILAMGSPETATRRLNLAQSFNPMGSIMGLVVAQIFILKKLRSATLETNTYAALSSVEKSVIKTNDLLSIRTPYVILGFVVLIFFIIVALCKMPENKTEIKRKENLLTTIKQLLLNKKYVLSIIAQMFYVGAQIMCWTYILHYAEVIGISNEKAINYLYFAYLFFVLGRILGTYVLKYINADKLLFWASLGATLCTIFTITCQNMFGLYSLVCVSFFMSIMFPTIYGIGLNGITGYSAKIGAAGLVMAIVGGALLPKIQSIIIDIGGTNFNDISILGMSEVNISFILPLICFIIIGGYAIKIRNYHR